ncbi:MAG: DUF4380 domain-containing protein [Anaerolineales bacterium]|nr:DUF4380 domain-containing protein [Anaerolineales bacterium]
MKKPEKVSYGGWDNCLKLETDNIELIITLDVGPRIIRFGIPGGQNLFKEFEDQMGVTSGDEWMSFGGHRLWHAPEVYPRTYAPDFNPVEYVWQNDVLNLTQRTEPETGIQKEIELGFDDYSVLLKHRLINRNAWAIDVAPWCLSVMASGGRAIIPQEEFKPHPEVLTPARPLVLWHFTRMNDPRFTWGDRLIQLREDNQINSKQKIGMLNTQGWVAYELGRDLFIKSIPYINGETYADMGCNCEFFTMPGFLELETLGPLTKIYPNGSIEHLERWWLLSGVELPKEEKPLITALNLYLETLGLNLIEG